MIGILICSIVVFTAIMFFIKFYKSKFTKKFHVIIHTLGLPIVSYESNGHQLNFLIDTGSNKSHLKLGIAEKIGATPICTTEENVVTTGNGAAKQYGYYNVYLTLSDNLVICQDFEIMDLEETFSDWGIRVDGILGIDFLSKYHYKLNFKKLIMHV